MTDHQLVDLGIEGLDHAVHIGAGGAADVYRAEQLGLGRTVAVKILRSATSAKNQARFERETQSLGRLSSHPGIVTLFQAGITVRGQAFFDHGVLLEGDLGRSHRDTRTAQVARSVQDRQWNRHGCR